MKERLLPKALRQLACLMGFLFLVACGEPTEKRGDKGEQVLNNQTTLTFLVFDRAATDSFLTTYKPFQYSNKRLLDAFRDSLLPIDFDGENIESSQIAIKAYSGNTRPPGRSNFNLASQIVTATLELGGDQHFSASLIYYFFYCCLPSKFHHKWAQTTFGDFEFNAKFLDRLRKQSPELNALIEGNSGTWSEDLQMVFDGEIYKEISPGTAAAIRNALMGSDEFTEEPFRSEKSNLLELLSRAISGEWRLILMDWS